MENALATLAADLVRLDSISSRSNLAVAERIEAELNGFEVERLDYADAAGVSKRALVAHRGAPGALALSGHMDTVPDTGWTDDPWSGALRDGVLHGLGSVDMKGAVAAAILAAREARNATLLLTTDEETTKQGARIIVERSALARKAAPRGIVVAEPTGLVPVRGHRASINFSAVAHGVQAHSSTGDGVNANWALIPFLVELRNIQAMLRNDPAWHDAAYAPPFCDFNLVLDNGGTAVNVTVARATARVKFRHSRGLDPEPVMARVRAAARAQGLALEEAVEGVPPELPVDHPIVALASRLTGHAPRTVPFGTDATVLQEIAPSIVLGPGSIETAHTPRECVPLAELEAARVLFSRMLNEAA